MDEARSRAAPSRKGVGAGLGGNGARVSQTRREMSRKARARDELGAKSPVADDAGQGTRVREHSMDAAQRMAEHGARGRRRLGARQGLGRDARLPKPVLGQEQPPQGAEITAEVQNAMNDEPGRRERVRGLLRALVRLARQCEKKKCFGIAA